MDVILMMMMMTGQDEDNSSDEYITPYFVELFQSTNFDFIEMPSSPDPSSVVTDTKLLDEFTDLFKLKLNDNILL